MGEKLGKSRISRSNNQSFSSIGGNVIKDVQIFYRSWWWPSYWVKKKGLWVSGICGQLIDHRLRAMLSYSKENYSDKSTRRRGPGMRRMASLSVNTKGTEDILYMPRCKWNKIFFSILNGERLQFCNEIKYLGVTLDGKISKRTHIERGAGGSLTPCSS